VVGDGNEMFRINLEDGQFMAPMTSLSPAMNCIDIAGPTQLIMTGGEDSVVELWDPRTRASVSRLDASLAFGDAHRSPVCACACTCVCLLVYMYMYKYDCMSL
jgi:hypothetical protein